MTTFTLSRTLAFAAVIAAGPALSQELAQSILDEYAQDMAASGMTMTPGETMTSGQSVEWKNVQITGQDGISYTLEFLKAEEIGGDKVRLTYPDSIAMTFDPEGEQPQMDLTVSMAGVDHVVSGSADARRHDYKAPSISVNMTSQDGEVAIAFTLNDVVTEYTRSGAEVPNYKGSLKAAEATIDQTVKEDGTDVAMNVVYTNLSGAMDVDAVNQENIALLLSGARNVAMSFGMESSAGTIDITSSDFSGTVNMQTGGGQAEFGVRDGMLNVNSASNDANYVLTMKELPLPPFEMAMDQVGMTLAMPLKKTDDVVPAEVKVNITGLKASDTIWGMIDPAGSIPRDAANLNIDLTAQLKWLVELMEAQNAKAPPVEVQKVDINDITLEIGGAALNGSGSAVINNATMPPMPVGEVNLDLKGGIGLVDKLVGIGLVPAEQGQMVKMMSGMFAVPGDQGPDHLTSKIEFQEGGAILANGQRIQ